MNHAGSGIIIQDNKILLIQRPKNTSYYPLHWAFPGGRAEKGETPEETTIREVKEEVGLDFQIKELIAQGEYRGKQLYRYYGTATGKLKIQEEEVYNYGWFTYEETKKLLLAHDTEEIIDKTREILDFKF